MRLATLRDGTRDGALVVVDPEGQRYAPASDIAPTLQAALDAWSECEDALRERSAELARGAREGRPIDPAKMAPPLPRAYEWIDGSAYIHHIVLVRRARGVPPPETLETEPLVYQGGSGVLLGPRDDIPLADAAWGLDFESELGVVLGDTPQGTRKSEAAGCVRLLVVANDVTLRNLVPGELAKGFGFFQSKPATAFAPFAITPDELGGAWQGGRAHLTLRTWLNGALVGDTATGPEMHFSFFDLIEHVAKTRGFSAGTILGSGTVSNVDDARGVSCLAERRMREILATGAAHTPFLAVGDRVRIEAFDAGEHSPFGAIDQRVVPFSSPREGAR